MNSILITTKAFCRDNEIKNISDLNIGGVKIEKIERYNSSFVDSRFVDIPFDLPDKFRHPVTLEFPFTKVITSEGLLYGCYGTLILDIEFEENTPYKEAVIAVNALTKTMDNLYSIGVWPYREIIAASLEYLRKK